MTTAAAESPPVQPIAPAHPAEDPPTIPAAPMTSAPVGLPAAPGADPPRVAVPASAPSSAPEIEAEATGTNGRALRLVPRVSIPAPEPTPGPTAQVDGEELDEAQPIETPAAAGKFTNTPQSDLVEAADRLWKNSKYDIPYPPRHVVGLHGGRSGRQGKGLTSGIMFQRRALCIQCGKDIKPVVGYLSGRQVKTLKGEPRHGRINIIKGILRKKLEEVEARLFNLRCPACDPRGESRRGRPGEA